MKTTRETWFPSQSNQLSICLYVYTVNTNVNSLDFSGVCAISYTIKRQPRSCQFYIMIDCITLLLMHRFVLKCHVETGPFLGHLFSNNALRILFVSLVAYVLLTNTSFENKLQLYKIGLK